MQKNVEKKQIVILGGGFAGVRAALDLSELIKENPGYQIVLVDKKDGQVYHPALYEAATTEHDLVEARKVKQAVSFPYTEVFKNSNVVCLKAYVEDIDFENGLVQTESGPRSFTYLVIALGSQPNYYGIPDLTKYAFPLKTFEDAIMIRNRVADIVSKKDKATIIIGGAGVSGVEFAAELRGLIKLLSKKYGKTPSAYKILMVEGATDFLPNLTVKASEAVSDRLRDKFQIETQFSTLVTEAGNGFVVLSNREKVGCDLLVWTGGIKSVRLPAFSLLERDKNDRLVVTDCLNLKKYPNVFVAGDLAAFKNMDTKKGLPQTKAEAVSQGSHVAKNIFRMIAREAPIAYSAKLRGYAFQVGGKYAVYHSRDLIMSGRIAWLIKRWKDWMYLRSVLPFPKAVKIWVTGSEIFTKND